MTTSMKFFGEEMEPASYSKDARKFRKYIKKFDAKCEFKVYRHGIEEKYCKLRFTFGRGTQFLRLLARYGRSRMSDPHVSNRQWAAWRHFRGRIDDLGSDTWTCEIKYDTPWKDWTKRYSDAYANRPIPTKWTSLPRLDGFTLQLRFPSRDLSLLNECLAATFKLRAQKRTSPTHLQAGGKARIQVVKD